MIEFKGVHKIYESGGKSQIKALKDVNICIDKGEFVFIVGESGAGKSTFLKLITREEVPTAGEVVVNGYNLSKLSRKQIPYMRRTMGVVFQDFRLINTMNVFDNVAFAMRVIGAPNREIHKRVPYVLQLVGLSDKMRSFPQELSGGEQQRVSLARALANNPSMIIADEPTGNVDPEMSFEIMELLNAVNRLGTTVIVVTHEHNLVERFDRRVIHISDGVVVSDSQKKTVAAEAPAAAEDAVFSQTEVDASKAAAAEETAAQEIDRLEEQSEKKAAKKAEKEARKAEKAAKKAARAEKKAMKNQPSEELPSRVTIAPEEEDEPEFKVIEEAATLQTPAVSNEEGGDAQ